MTIRNSEANEEALIEKIPSEEEDKDVGVPLYEIVSYPSDPTLDGLYQKKQRGEIIIPPFQRGWVWTHTQASRLIESFLLGLPVPSIFVYRERPSQIQVVIDGQQRLRTVWGFFDGQLPDPDGRLFSLRGVSPKWEGKTYHDLDQSDQIRFRDSVLRVVIVEQLRPEDKSSTYHIFERLNTGGTALNPQEVRNSTYHGPFNNLMIDLNKNTTWRAIFGSEQPHARMRDVELVVRFCALFEGAESYTKSMKRFLNTFMERHQWDEAREPYESVFLETVRKVKDALGPRPFHVRRGINVAVFDSVTLAFAGSTPIPDDIDSRFERLISDSDYDAATRTHTTDVEIVRRRIRLAREILFG